MLLTKRENFFFQTLAGDGLESGPHLCNALVYGHIRDFHLGGNFALSHASGDAFQNGAIHGVPASLEAFQVGANDGAGLGVGGQVGDSGLGVAFGLAVVVHHLKVRSGGVFAVLVENGGDAGAGGVVNDGDQSNRPFTLSGAAFIGGGQLVRIKSGGNSQPGFRNKLIKIMQAVQTERGHLGELQVMVFGAVADGVFCGLVNATLHHGDLVSLSHSAPGGDALGSIAGGVLSFSLGPCYSETFAHQDFRNAAAHLGGGFAADSPGAAHDGGAVVGLAGGGVGGGGGLHSGNPFQE